MGVRVGLGSGPAEGDVLHAHARGIGDVLQQKGEVGEAFVGRAVVAMSE